MPCFLAVYDGDDEAFFLDFGHLDIGRGVADGELIGVEPVSWTPTHLQWRAHDGEIDLRSEAPQSPLDVRMLDRNRRGVERTIYGQTLLKRGLAAFDELKQSIRDIEFLADSAQGAPH